MITILIVDDSDADLATYTHYLQSNPLQLSESLTILAAKTVEAGLAIWRSEAVDVVLLRVQASGKASNDCARLNTIAKMRVRGGGLALPTPLPIICLLEPEDEAIAAEAIAIGAATYLLKPQITPIALQASIQQAHHHHTLQLAQQTAEAQLAAYEQRYLSLTETVPVGLFRLDVSGNYTYVNSYWCKLVGREAPLTIGYPWHCHIHAEDHAPIVTQWQQNQRDYTTFAAEYRLDQSLQLCNLLPNPKSLNNPSSPNPNLQTATLHPQQHLGEVWVYTQILPERDHLGQINGYVGTMTDISNQKQAQAEQLVAETVRQEFNILENLLDTALAGYWDFDLINQVEYLSPGFKRMFGYEVDELENTPECWQSLVLPEDLPRVLEGFGQYLANHHHLPYRTELRYLHKSGSIVWVICVGQIVEWDDQGNPARMVGCHIDITPLKQVEAELEASRAKFQRLVDDIGDKFMIFSHDPYTGQVNYVSEGITTLFGLTKDQVIGQSWQELVEWQRGAQETVQQADAALIEQGLEFQQFELQFKHSDQTIHTILVSQHPAKDQEGQIVAIEGIIEDITEIKRAESALRESEARWNFALEGSGDGVWDWHAPSNTVFFSDQWKAMLGYAPEEVGNTLAEWDSRVHPDDKAMCYEKLEAHFRGETPIYQSEHRMRCKDGSYKWIFDRGKVIQWGEDGKPLRVIGTHTDITARKETEQSLQAAKEAAEYANRAKSDFLALMSHEIRTPMNGILGLTYLTLQTTLTPQQREYLDKIQISSQALLNIINDILDFSKVEAGKLELESTQFSLGEVLNNLHNILSLKASEKQISFQIHCDAQIPDRLVGDPLRLGQILINLAGNAVKFTEVGGVTIAVQLLEMCTDAVQLKFLVRDTGIGLSPTQIENLFNAFTQADASISRKYSGTGLGLAISQRLANLMGGTIEVESQPEVGSIFAFELRLAWVNSAQFSAELDVNSTASYLPLISPPNVSVSGQTFPQTLYQNSHQTVNQTVNQAVHHSACHCGTCHEARSHVNEPTKSLAEPITDPLTPAQPPASAGVTAAATHFNPSPQTVQPPAIAPIERLPVPPMHAVQAMQSQGANGGANGLSKGRSNPDTHVAAERLNGASILLVEDNAVNQLVAQEMLKRLGLRVEIAVNGQEALTKIQAQPYHLILMDVRMPEMDGLEATARIRQLASQDLPDRDRFATVPIVAMTAHAFQSDRQKSLEAGMNDHITKPISPEVLSATLLRWLVSPAVVSPGVMMSPPSAIGTNATTVTQLTSSAVTASAMPDHLDRHSPENPNHDTMTQRVNPSEFPENLYENFQESLDNDSYTDFYDSLEACEDILTPSKHYLNDDSESDDAEGIEASFNLETGLLRLGGDWNIYCELLNLFYDTYAGLPETLRILLETQNWQELHYQAHTLKGAAGNVGAEALFKAATVLSDRLRQCDTLSGQCLQPPELEQRVFEDHQKLQAALTNTLDTIKIFNSSEDLE